MIQYHDDHRWEKWQMANLHSNRAHCRFTPSLSFSRWNLSAPFATHSHPTRQHDHTHSFHHISHKIIYHYDPHNVLIHIWYIIHMVDHSSFICVELRIIDRLCLVYIIVCHTHLSQPKHITPHPHPCYPMQLFMLITMMCSSMCVSVHTHISTARVAGCSQHTFATQRCAASAYTHMYTTTSQLFDKTYVILHALHDGVCDLCILCMYIISVASCT